ncbi:MAG: hypothetical protein GX117_10910 [Candidatus Hydrogenedentes bacterium]|nr:hypothetical protein [Candidatus Hydrogenedentota bacterium]
MKDLFKNEGKGKNMKKVMVLVVVGLCLGLLSGCWQQGKASFVVHNMRESFDEEDNDLAFLSLVKVADECAYQTPEGVNLLPKPIPYNGTFKMSGLDAGTYYCIVYTWDRDWDDRGFVTLSERQTTHWYVKW